MNHASGPGGVPGSAGPSPHATTASPGDGAVRHDRRLRACLGFASGYLWLVVALLLLRLTAAPWGIIVSKRERGAMWAAIALHGVLAIAIAFLRRRGRFSAPTAATLSKYALAFLPFMFLLSADRLAVVYYEPMLPIGNSYRVLTRHPTRDWTNRPGWTSRGERYHVRINSLGLRGPEVPYEKPPGERRVLFLGDSITFGYGLEEEDCFVWQFAQSLANDPSNQDVSVVNCSVIGYSPWQELDILQEEGLNYDPDYIILTFCLNDVLQKYELTRYGGSTIGDAPPTLTFELFGLYRIARSLVHWHREDQPPSPQRDTSAIHLIHDPDAPDILAAWEQTLANMARIVKVAREAEVPIAIVCFPYFTQIDETQAPTPSPQQTLTTFANGMEVPVLDLLPAYRQHARTMELSGIDMLPDAIHPAADANQVAATEIEKFLIHLGWLE